MRATLNCEVQHLLVSKNPAGLSDSSDSEASPRILLADDQQRIAQVVLCWLLDRFNVVGIAKNGIHAIELATELLPDVLILDISMPVLSGIETARRLRRSGSYAKIVFLSACADRDFVDAAFSAGALAYVLKSCIATDLILAIQAVLEGKTFISPSIPFR